MNFSEIIKEKLNDKSPYDLAEDYGVSHTTIYKIINGEMDNPSVLLAARLCAMLDIDPNTLRQFDFHPDETYIRKVEEKMEIAKDKELFENEIQSLLIDRLVTIEINNLSTRHPYKSKNIGVMNFGNLGNTYVVLHDNRIKDEAVIEFRLPVRRISSQSNSYDYKSLGDFFTIMMALLSEQSFVVDNQDSNLPANITITNDGNKSSITKSVKNFVFSTTSGLLYSELCKYVIKDVKKYNITLFYRYKDSYHCESTVLLGDKIMNSRALFLYNIAR